MKTSHRYLILIGVGVCGVVFLNYALAQPAADKPRAAACIAVCDIVEVFNNYERAKDLTARLNERGRQIQAEKAKRNIPIEEIADELKRLKQGSEEYEKRFNEMQRLAIELQGWLKLNEDKAIREHHQFTKEMYRQILDTVAKEAKNRGYKVVAFEERGDLQSTNTSELIREIARRRVLYSDPGVDITGMVLSRLNKSYRAATP